MNDKNKIKMFSTDLDGTFLDEIESMNHFRKLWAALKPEDRPLLCYNSGRLVYDVKQLVSVRILPEPDYIIGGVGTSLYDFKKDTTLKEFAEILKKN